MLHYAHENGCAHIYYLKVPLRQYAIIGRQYMYVCRQNLVYLYDEY